MHTNIFSCIINLCLNHSKDGGFIVMSNWKMILWLDTVKLQTQRTGYKLCIMVYKSVSHGGSS